MNLKAPSDVGGRKAFINGAHKDEDDRYIFSNPNLIRAKVYFEH